MNPKTQQTLNRIKYLIKEIATLVNQFPKTTVAFKIVNQIMDSVTSIGANFVEAQSARSKKEFISTIGIVLKETKETLFWLEIIQELNLTSKEKIDKNYKECSELAKIFTSVIMTTSKRLR
jgi:four helix bundle protein